ncbi:MAG TPA: hypothetical protein VJH92_00770 [Candidatus Nanoarchaeia archaeon]|nr:hypothetical protein [Candidatus Nanoarchaeia archaeon]
MAKKRAKRVTKPAGVSKASKKPVRYIQPKKRSGMKLVVNNFFLFLILMIVSILLGFVFTDPIVDELFWMLTMLTAFICLALVLVMLILLFMNALKK